MSDKPKIEKVSAEQLQKLQDEFKEEDLSNRSENIKLEDIMIIRAKDARMAHPKEITFDDEDEKT